MPYAPDPDDPTVQATLGVGAALTKPPTGARCADPSASLGCRNPAKHMVVPVNYSGEPYRVTEGGRLVAPYRRDDDRPVSGPVPMCGVHRRKHVQSARRGDAEHEARERRQQKARELAERVGYATNVAVLLGGALRTPVYASESGAVVEIDANAANLLLSALTSGRLVWKD